MVAPSRRSWTKWVSWLALASAGVYLQARWDSIPERWASHWDILGRPNGWSGRTVLGVFGPLLAGVAVLLTLDMVGVLVRRRTADDAAMEPVRDATRTLMNGMALAISLLFSLLAITLPLGPRLSPGVLAGLAVGLPAVGVGLGGRRLSIALRQVRRSGHAARVEGYHGLYYANRKDTRLWVPKLGGVGLTLNFAHPWAWPMMLLLAGLPIALVVVSVATAHR